MRPLSPTGGPGGARFAASRDRWTLRPRRRRADPAPSRLSYRLQRLMLSPLLRAFVLRALPAGAVAFFAGSYFLDPVNLDNLRNTAAEWRAAVVNRPEFMLRMMRVQGATEELAADITEVAGVDFPVSSFDVDLDELRRRIESLDAVARAELRVVGAGVIEARVVPRVPAVVWRSEEGLELLDAQGHRVAGIAHRADRPDLPLVIGEDAPEHVGEAVAIFAAARPFLGQIRALVRVGGRRWDMVLAGGRRILLPEEGAPAAVERVAGLDRAHDLLARDLEIIDMRIPERVTLRLTPRAAARLGLAAPPPLPGAQAPPQAAGHGDG
ncbi:MAG: cell division protein FtsQ [Alphaproteobacteria bacterium]|nr:MAG: cell division protein FtsQ [Alphaproteobacteria bacterium]